MKGWVRWLWVMLSLAAASQSVASESLRIGGGQAQVQLQFRIIIPQFLYLQIGSEQPPLTIEDFRKVILPEASKVVGEPQQIRVRAAGSVSGKQPIALTTNFVSPISDGSRTMPSQVISWGVPGEQGCFGGGANLRVDAWQGSGNRSFSFSYVKGEKYPRGNGAGKVIYTLSAP